MPGKSVLWMTGKHHEVFLHVLRSDSRAKADGSEAFPAEEFGFQALDFRFILKIPV